jgi:F-type H+-transporting ATPase subunit gamma
MANLKEIRGRITSIASTMQITSAMKLVSAAKLKKAQDAITMLRPYSEKLQEIIQNLTNASDQDNLSAFALKRPAKRILLVAVSSNRGLCGAFNTNVFKEVNKNLKAFANTQIEVLTLGKKINDALKNQTIYSNQSSIFDNLSFEKVSALTDEIMERFTAGYFDEVYLVYNKFINAALQEVKTEQLLPISLPEKQEVAPKDELNKDYIFEPSQAELLNNLIPKSIRTQVFKAILDSVASENGARMTAMHKATDNANDMKNELVIYYNKARQAAITNEILEIVSGAEALKA